MSSKTELYSIQTFNIKETIKSSELNDLDLSNNQNINSILLEKIRNNLGDKCNEVGYIEKDTIEIISRSIGTINTSHFNGDIYYNIKVQANVCIPSEGTTIRCKIIGKNKIGIFAILNPIHVILASEHHAHEHIETFENLQKGEEIYVEIINYKFKLNSNIIQVLAKFVKKAYQKKK